MREISVQLSRGNCMTGDWDFAETATLSHTGIFRGLKRSCTKHTFQSPIIILASSHFRPRNSSAGLNLIIGDPNKTSSKITQFTPCIAYKIKYGSQLRHLVFHPRANSRRLSVSFLRIDYHSRCKIQTCTLDAKCTASILLSIRQFTKHLWARTHMTHRIKDNGVMVAESILTATRYACNSNRRSPAYTWKWRLSLVRASAL